MDLVLGEFYHQMLPVALENKKIFTAVFELTTRCNLRCKMCYVSQAANDKKFKNSELAAEQWLKIAEEARDAGLLFLKLSGGEVFLREDFKYIYEKLNKMGFLIIIYTNGTMITSEIARWLADIPPYYVSISLYGASTETYKKVTGFADGYNRMRKAVDALLANGIRVELKTTVVEENKNEYDLLLNFARQRNIDLKVVNYVFPRREEGDKNPVECRLSPEDLVDYEIHINKCKDELGTVKKVKRRSEDMLPAKYDPNDAFQCLAGKCAAYITWDGRLLPCALIDTIEAFPLKQGFASAWEEIKQKCRQVSSCKECLNCQDKSYCEHCPGRLLRETGSFERAAPYLCELAQKRKAVAHWRRI